MRKYWMASISKEHTLRGVSDNFIQVCHGKQAPLKRMKKGDGIIIYSAKQTMTGAEKCQAFTAVGEVADEEVYQFKMTEDVEPYRRNIQFRDCSEAQIIPLIDQLEFIQNKKSWGYPFRFGFFEIGENDFNLIVSKMNANEID
ncbi:EVE domain-containing protein [Chitinophaga sp. HK235]|uniref:EVE domain-containing protein n=1 Tax=Chitinophaga sp. HK235 TaxID=2952571 RepID=UPI001BA83BD0|nr:EVE domain-containing protein [Chitinophaga sp. HK235]